ncbi:MAG: TolC family protein, partial [Planctomycetota bacterium]
MARKRFSLLASAALASAAFLIAGCTMIPEYTRPEAPVPAEWPSGPAYTGASTAEDAPLAADLPWRDFFIDERLRIVIETALENNRDLRVAALNVERARAMYRIQRAELLPVVDATGSGSKERVPADLSSSGHAMNTERYSAGLGISSWEIDFFGYLRSLEKGALEVYLATEQARRGAQILLVSEVAGAYLALAADRENLDLARATLETRKAAFELIQRRYEVGITSELDVFQARTRYDAARVDAARYTELIARDENALTLLVGGSLPADLLPEAL